MLLKRRSTSPARHRLGSPVLAKLLDPSDRSAGTNRVLFGRFTSGCSVFDKLNDAYFNSPG